MLIPEITEILKHHKLGYHYSIYNTIYIDKSTTVFAVKNQEKRRRDILKVFKCIYEEESLSLYFQTIKIVNMVHHPNICHIYSTSIFQKEIPSLFLIMDLYNKSLTYYIHKINGINSLNKIQIMLNICEGIKCLNSLNITHGNLKLENVLLNEDGTCAISDYCLNNIKLKDTYNTEYYEFQSPEQMMNKEVNNKTDIWSIGCIFYFILKSEKPFQSKSLYNLQCQILSGKYIQFIPAKKYKNIIDKMIVVNPNERMNIDAVISSLKRFEKPETTEDGEIKPSIDGMDQLMLDNECVAIDKIIYDCDYKSDYTSLYLLLKNIVMQNSFSLFFTLVNIVWYSSNNKIIKEINDFFIQFLESNSHPELSEGNRVMYKLLSLLCKEPFSLFIKQLSINETRILSDNLYRINNLTKLYLHQCGLDDDSSIMFFRSFSCLEELETLSIRNFHFTDENINELSNSLSMLCYLNELEFECNLFTKSQSKMLFSSLPSIKYLTIFTFQYNILDENEFQFLKDQLLNVKRLKILNLYGTNLVGKCAKLLYELLQRLKCLRVVKLPDTIKCSSVFINAFPQIDITFSGF